MSKATINPYLTFNGNCREAMMFYKECLDGDIEIMPFEGSPVEVPEDHKQKVLHSRVSFGNAMIMASDGMPGSKTVIGDANAISINTEQIDEAQEYFNNLSTGGTVIMKFEETFWGAKFGMFNDKYGVRWMINCTLPQQ